MIYAEAAYFEGNHCAHVAARDEANRLAQIDKRNRLAIREHGRARLRDARK